ncbi:helix-turn-helix domain-containing protein [Cupriavidus metallidurans]|nr:MULTISPECIES: helix-turn-helix domain-containing protein [Cupriavidus]MDE4920263.1 helix-turn-helix domain-containing protein [Cupriavidus metallidurans]
MTFWKQRFVAHGLAGLHDQAKSGGPRTHDDEAVAELLSKVLHEKPRGSTHWSVRSAAEETGISKISVARYFALFGVQRASRQEFQAVERSVLYREGARHRRFVSQPAYKCIGLVRGREEPVPGARAHTARTANGAQLRRGCHA